MKRDRTPAAAGAGHLFLWSVSLLLGLGRAVADLDLDLTRLGVLRLGHRHQQQAVLVDRLDPRRFDGSAEPQRAAELGRPGLLPDGAGTLRHLEAQLTLD